MKTFVFSGGTAQSWCPQFADLSPWIQVDLKSRVYITGVVTQGRGDSDQRMTKYRCMYSDDGQQWTSVLYPNGTIAEVSDREMNGTRRPLSCNDHHIDRFSTLF